MPLGIVSDKEFLEELLNNSSSNKVSIKEIPSKGRGNKEETPEVIRKIIGEEKVLGASNKELAEIFNVSQSSVSAYGNGSTSTKSYKEGDSELRKHLFGVRDKIVKRASKKLNIALTSLSEEDINDSKPIEKAQIAKIMSGVIKDMIPEEKNDQNNIQFVFFAPKMREESSYDVIDVSGLE